MVRVSSATVRVLSSEEWPVQGSLGDLLLAALNDVPENIWDQAFSLTDLSWLPQLITPEVPRTYSISSFHQDLLPDVLQLTVARAEHTLSPLLNMSDGKITRPGVSSGFLNPDPTLGAEPRHHLIADTSLEEKVCIVSFKDIL